MLKKRIIFGSVCGVPGGKKGGRTKGVNGCYKSQRRGPDFYRLSGEPGFQGVR